MVRYSAGIVTAYGAAKRAGYTGTYEDFCRQQAEYAESAAAVEQAKTTAVNAAATATTKAGEATTAATAAQTAKTQTEAAASRALTDISTARSGAISAVQTEGATQTANATAQAQAAATSATTASTKASEASASATTATTKATEAAASATSAAQSASNAQDVLDSIPADYSDLSANVSQLQADLDKIVETTETTETTKTAQDVEKVRNAYWWNREVSSSSYYYVHLTNLSEGDVVTVSVDDFGQPMRFIDAYNGATRDTSNGSLETVRSYTVPSGVDNVYVSCEIRYVNTSVFYVEHTKVTVSTYPKGVKRLDDDVTIIQNQLDGLIGHGHNWIEFKADSVIANTDYIVQNRVDNKKNCVYTIEGKFSEFTGLSIGHGYSTATATWLVIDGTNMTIFGTGGTQYQQFAHGLTITDFINVIIKVADISSARATVTIRTATGEYTKDDVIFFGCSGSVWFNPLQNMTEVKFTYILLDMLKDVYVFGDSYISLADNNRWPKYTIDAGYNGALLSGYGGVTSQGELTSFNNIMAIKKPKTCAWFLGMNDPDPSSSINSNWESAINSVISICNTNGIELVLATIPNTPTMNNVFKNEYVRASGYRYVDFAKAVNAESANAPWYAGMLSSDNVHPTVNGAKALASRVILDFPEIAG